MCIKKRTWHHGETLQIVKFLYRVSKKKLTALKCKLVAPNPIGTKHIK